MPRRTIRLPNAIDDKIDGAAKLRGYSSPSAFLRAAIKKEVSERTEGTGVSIEQIVGSLVGIQRSTGRLERAQQALFALVDSLTKAFLTCVPEPRGVALEPALSEARNRHARLLSTAGHAMHSDSMNAMEDLMNAGEKGISRGEK